MWPFKCKHPARNLFVKKDATVEPSPKYPENFTNITYHLFCNHCRADVDIKYAKMIGGVDEFLKRGKDEVSNNSNS